MRAAPRRLLRGTDWLRLATRLAATPSPCAQYYVSIPPLAADKTRSAPRPGVADRALGPAFHALAEINVTGWTAWVASTGNGWYAAGVEARRRMAAAGYDVAAGDTWALNELTSAVRQGTGNARANMRAFLAACTRATAVRPARGVVFTSGSAKGRSSSPSTRRGSRTGTRTRPSGPTSRTTSDWSQELYGDVRNYAVAGAAPSSGATR